LTNISVDALNLSALNYWTKDGSDLFYSGGNVGIGTGSPTRLLTVGSTSTASSFMNIVSNGFSTIAFGDAADDNRAQIIYSHTLDKLSFQTGGGSAIGVGKDRLLIDVAGNVGIGTTSPASILHVNGSAIINGTLNMDSNKIISLANGTVSTDAVTLGQLQQVNNTVSGDYVPYTGSSANVVLGGYDFSVNTSDLFVDVSAGRVGIGTASPDNMLEIVGPGGSIDVLKLTKGTGTSGIKFVFNEAGSYPSYIQTYEAADAGYMRIGVNSGSASTREVMRLMGSGNVGIGTTSPNAKLEVTGDVIIDLSD